MKAARGFLTLCVGVALIAAACGPDEAQTLDALEDPAPVAGAAPAPDPAGLGLGYEHVIAGSLGRVDPDAMTFTLRTDIAEQSFRFTSATDVSGASGAQGLTGREGARVTVHYREDAGARLATRVVLEDTAAGR